MTQIFCIRHYSFTDLCKIFQNWCKNFVVILTYFVSAFNIIHIVIECKLFVFGNPISYIDTILFKTNANYLHQFSISLYQIVYNSSHGQKTKQSVKKQSF